MGKLLMQINKRNITAVLSLSALVLLLTLCLYPVLGQATGVERITIEDALGWEVAQGTPSVDSQDNTEVEEEGDLESKNNTILEVKVEGNRRVAAELVRANVSSKVGSTLSTAMVREDVKKIYSLGSFEDVAAEIDRTENGIILVYKVKEKPIIADLRITGNKDVKSDDILEVISVREGRIIDLNNVKKSQEIIGELYSEKGLVGTVVDYEIEPEGDGTVSVIFDIQEGKKAYIKEVNFVGNEKLKTKVIKKGIYSKSKGMFSFISKKGLFNLREVQNDSERIRTTYIDNGFLDVKVGKPEIDFSEEKKGYIVTFKISEGDPFTVNELSFDGDLIVPVEELQEVLSLKSGEVFRGSLLARDISGLTTFYGNKGFAFANAEPAFALNRDELTVDIRFTLEKGPEVFIREINIIGNTRTRDKVIRREIPIQEDQLYNASEVQAVRPRVRRLGFFEENVEVVSQRVPGQEDKLDLEVRVEEKSTGFFSLSGGFSSIETFIFAGQIQESNLFGYGKRASLNAQIGGVTQLFFLTYGDPNFWDTDFTLDATIFRTDRAFRDFDRSSIGASLTFGRRVWRWLVVDLTYRIENVKISDIDNNARLILTSENRTISSIGFGLKWDSRNNLLDPSRGNLTQTALTFAGGPFGGNTDFIKYILSSRQWFSLPFNTVFTVRARYGIINFSNNGNDLVVGERFFLGGPNSLRGFGFRRVGPRVPTEDGNFVIIGGVQELLFSADYVFPLLPSAGLRGVIFFDMGNAFNDGEDFTVNPSDLRTDVGFGFRWISPLGPLRLEIGIPVGDRLPDENSYEIQFTVGTLF